MRALVSKAEIQSEVTEHLETAFKLHERAPAETLSTGNSEIDVITKGLPRGAITEIFGSSSSGRTSFMLSALAHATNIQEVCALVDANDVFDPTSASGARMVFDQLLWVRCAAEGTINVSEGKRIERAFKAADLLLQSGGFGVVALDLADISPQNVRRIISSWWFRFRRAIENTPTILIVAAQVSCVGSRAALALEVIKEEVVWTSVKDEALANSSRGCVIPFYSKPAGRFQKINIPPTSSTSVGLRDELLLHSMQLNVERQKPVSLETRKARVQVVTTS